MSLKLVKGDDESRPSADEFRISASDTKGHSARLWFRCIPAMTRQLEQILQARQFPYRTKGDILRHALHRHMRWLNTLEPISSVCSQVDAILELMRDEEMNNDFSLVFEKLEDRISRHTAEGSEKEAMRLLMIVQGHVGSMPDGFWKDKYKGKLQDKYGGLLKKATKANLGIME